MVNEFRRQIWQQRRKEAEALQRQAQKAEGKAAAAKHKEDGKLTKKLADAVKGALYALGKAPENLTARQNATLALIQSKEPKLYRVYQHKEMLRNILRLPDAEEAAAELKSWYFKATPSRIPVVIDLAKKIRRHEQGILNALRYRVNNARVEATNSKIQLIIRKDRGFRNTDSLIAMVMLICSNLEIPLPNRPQIQALAA